MPDSESPAKKAPIKYRKGDLIRVDRVKYQNSLESTANDPVLPEYIFTGPGEILLVKGDYCQVRWRRPVPDVWFRLDHVQRWNEN